VHGCVRACARLRACVRACMVLCARAWFCARVHGGVRAWVSACVCMCVPACVRPSKYTQLYRNTVRQHYDNFICTAHSLQLLPYNTILICIAHFVFPHLYTTLDYTVLSYGTVLSLCEKVGLHCTRFFFISVVDSCVQTWRVGVCICRDAKMSNVWFSSHTFLNTCNTVW
jgi:hypothetical protein